MKVKRKRAKKAFRLQHYIPLFCLLLIISSGLALVFSKKGCNLKLDQNRMPSSQVGREDALEDISLDIGKQIDSISPYLASIHQKLNQYSFEHFVTVKLPSGEDEDILVGEEIVDNQMQIFTKRLEVKSGKLTSGNLNSLNLYTLDLVAADDMEIAADYMRIYAKSYKDFKGKFVCKKKCTVFYSGDLPEGFKNRILGSYLIVKLE